MSDRIFKVKVKVEGRQTHAFICWLNLLYDFLRDEITLLITVSFQVRLILSYDDFFWEGQLEGKLFVEVFLWSIKTGLYWLWLWSDVIFFYYYYNNCRKKLFTNGNSIHKEFLHVLCIVFRCNSKNTIEKPFTN